MSKCAVERCRFMAMAHTAKCATHAAQDGDELASAVLAQRQAIGAEQRRQNTAGKKRTTASLRSTNDLLTELESALVNADNNGDTTAVIRIITEARNTLRAELLETENEELRDLLIEKHPELKKHLKAVK